MLQLVNNRRSIRKYFQKTNFGIKVYVTQDKYFASESERFTRKSKLLVFVFNLLDSLVYAALQM